MGSLSIRDSCDLGVYVGGPPFFRKRTLEPFLPQTWLKMDVAISSLGLHPYNIL